jgi:DNA-binding GntR family transcriptional regulator
VHSRAARPDEAELLELPAHGTYFLIIERTHYVGAQPVETCDITFPGDRYELTYSTRPVLKKSRPREGAA